MNEADIVARQAVLHIRDMSHVREMPGAGVEPIEPGITGPDPQISQVVFE